MKISLVGAGNILNAGLGFFFLAVVAKFLDLESFGRYALITTVLLSISKLIDFGTNSVYVARTISDKNFGLRNVFYTSKLILTLVAIPISLITLLMFQIKDPVLIFIFIFGLIAYGINYTLFALLQRHEKYTLLVLINTLPALVKGIFAVLVVLKIFTLNLENAVAIFSLSIFMSAIAYFYLPKEDKSFKIDLKDVKKLIAKATPAGISLFIYESFPAISNGIAKIVRGFSDVGVFSLANKISHVFVLVSLSIFTVLLPKNATRKSENQRYDFKETFIISLLILISSFVAIYVAEFMIFKLFGDKFNDSIKLLDILIFASALTAIHTFMENYFFIHDEINYIMYINVTKLAVYLMLCITLVETTGLTGLAISEFAASLVAVLLTGLFIRRLERF